MVAGSVALSGFLNRLNASFAPFSSGRYRPLSGTQLRELRVARVMVLSTDRRAGGDVGVGGARVCCDNRNLALDGLGRGNKWRVEALGVRGAGMSGEEASALALDLVLVGESGCEGCDWDGVEPGLDGVVLAAVPVMYWYQSVESKLKPVLGGRS